MIALHKAPQLPTPPSFHHRRAPSAPVVVQPTKTPGLLSLSRPPAGRTQPARAQPRARSPQRRNKPVSKADATATDVATPEKTQTATPAATPDRATRGRQQGARANKDKSRRSPSSSSPQRRNNQHQASPPMPSATPAEVTRPRRHGGPNRAQSFHQTPNSFDPFLATVDDVTSSPKQQPAHPTPKLTPRPSGRLARRRQQVPDSPTPAPAKAVPARVSQPNRHMSRSVPIASTPVRPAARRSATIEARESAFRVCDDNTDTEEDDSSAPVTPEREASPTWQQTQFNDASAPTGLAGFIVPAACVTPSPMARVHRREASDVSVFDMSFEDGWPAPGASPTTELAQMLFSLQRPSSAGPRKQQMFEPFFANSQFQNSPSPEDLPTVDF